MSLDEIEAIVARALPLRTPNFTSETTGAVKSAAIEGYLLTTAHIGGELEEARHWLRELEHNLAEQWRTMEGWEPYLVAGGRRTREQITQAKIKASPEMYAAGKKTRRLIGTVNAQIERFDREAKTLSRAYTVMTGS